MVLTFGEQHVAIINGIREIIGRNVIIHVVASSIPCSVCSLDPVTNTSTDSFCIVCSGVYWIPVYSGASRLAHITWGPTDALGWWTGGQLDEGEARIQVEYTDLNLSLVKSAKWITVDGKQMEVKNHILRGVKSINRILVDLKERDDG